ncbi:hypothetical protein F4861DRAFT_531968 [Xylaria intraflava]|nr:hypothetical protein F4861DRAFT_531968 [Xylaria intraflava]
MASKPDHLERTAAEPRDRSLNTVIVEHVEQINATTRIFRLGIPQGSPPIHFLPGQWLDVYVPGVKTAGGFTITSTPQEARLPHPSRSSPDNSPGADIPLRDMGAHAPQGPYLELAVQKSPDNPPAAWLWRDDPPVTLIGARLRVRVGGSFVWPPPGIDVRALRRVVFLAGGVGVNPLVSMLSSLGTAGADLDVHFLYSLKDPGPARDARGMLFLDRIAAVFREGRVRGRLRVFLTSGVGGDVGAKGEDGVIACRGAGDEAGAVGIPFHARRCALQDVVEAVGSTPAERRDAVVYICGVPTMTDEFVARLTGHEDGIGMEPHRVLCEKWW